MFIPETQNVNVGTPGTGAESAVDFGVLLDKLEYLPIRSSHAGLQGTFLDKPLVEGMTDGKKNNSIDPTKTLVNRTRSKTLDWVIKGRLMNDLTIKETSPLHRKYVQSTACNGTLTQEEGKIKAFYCKERWCSVCNRIRTATLINKYEPLVAEWDDKYFVTLTLKNTTGEELGQTIDEMIKLFGMCATSVKQTKKMEFLALRKIEVTFNEIEKTFHPHFHAVVKGKKQAKLLKDYWLGKVNKYKKNTEEYRAVEEAQKIGPCDENTVKEMFKYFTKLISDQKLNPEALDIIFQAMRGRRTFQAYLPKDVQEKIKQKGEDEEIVLDRGTSAITRLNETIHWDYIPEARNFVDTKTGELLTDYRPTATFERLLLKLNGEETSQADTRPLAVFRPCERDPVLDIVAKSESSAFTTPSGSGSTASLGSQAERFRRSKILTPHPSPSGRPQVCEGSRPAGRAGVFSCQWHEVCAG
ncbi:MAG: protein rep [bacterium]|nr:protein rep [bacterium]